MKKIVLGFIICLNSVAAFAQDTATTVHKFTLEDCLNYAFENNYNKQSMKLSEDAAKSVYDQSKMERLPNLNASLNESLNSSKGNSSSMNGNYGLSTNLTLYQGGSISNTIEQDKLKKEQSSYQTSQYENSLTVQILQAFLSVLGNEELLKYQYAVVNASEEQAKQGKLQFEAGQILESDFLLLEAQFASDKNNITDTQITIENSLLTLKNLLSMDPAENIQIVYPDTAAISEMSFIPSREYVLDQAKNTLPDFKISQYNVDIANMSTKLAKSSYFPTVNLYGNAGTGHNDYTNLGQQLSDRVNAQVGVSLSIPIYDNSRTKSKVTQSRIALQQAELDKKQTELDIIQTVITEYQDVISTYNKYQTTNIQQNAYWKTFQAYQAQFNVGSITAVSLLQQQNNYISALNNYIQSKYGFMLKRKILDVYMGVPVKM